MELSEKVIQLINQTQTSIFLTGKAGTGKTTLLQKIVQATYKNVAVTAPTGIAALNANGVTLHSFFQLPFGAFLPAEVPLETLNFGVNFLTPSSYHTQIKLRSQKQKILRNLELLIIDEVSMLRADTLDMIDFVLRFVRRNSQPFGGVQMLFIGDLLQLPPVVKPEEWEVLKLFYQGVFFFHSKVIEKNPPLYVELEKVYRQQDTDFISVLNHLRNNKITPADVALLNKYVRSDFQVDSGVIMLTTHNAKADKINREALEKIPQESFSFQAEIQNDFPEFLYPVDSVLILKKGAQVMFVKNDASKQFYNGSIGVVEALSSEEIWVRLTNENTLVLVKKYEWEHIRYAVDAQTNELIEEKLGSFTQYPLRTAWAITVHKSQGLTFEKAILDIDAVFAPGQAYVALSRLRSLNGLVLLSPLQTNGLFTPFDVERFALSKASESLISEVLLHQKKSYIEQLVLNAFAWEELALKWKEHLKSYQTETQRSVKSQLKKWVVVQNEKVQEILKFSQKFRYQLQTIFSQTYQISFVLERYEKAEAYFFPTLDAIGYELLLHQLEITSAKQTKILFEGLSQLSEFHFEAILSLLKIKEILKLLSQEKPLEKHAIVTDFIKNYKKNLFEKAHEVIKAKQIAFQESYSELESKKEAKVATHQKTWELWKKRMSVQAIASERNLSEKTIYTHLIQLISEKKILISEVISRAKIKELEQIFKRVKTSEISLNQVKEEVGDRFSWEELRMFKSYFQGQKK